MSRPGHMLYKCRLCGAVAEKLRVPDVVDALVFVHLCGETPRRWGVTHGMTELHFCESGGVGVADLIGGREEQLRTADANAPHA